MPPADKIDTTRPSIARVYDAFVGGKDNFEADREVVREIEALVPEAPLIGRQCRSWLIRVVRWLAREPQVEQFLDLGSGLPTAENTHQAVQRVNREAVVVYVDNDHTVAAHSRALLVDDDRTYFAFADLQDVDEVLSHPVVQENLNFDEPVGLIHSNTLHHVSDDSNPVGLMERYIDALAPGSYVAISHLHNEDDGSARAELGLTLQERLQSLMGSCFFRSHEKIAELFRDLEMVEPGLVYLHEWWPEGPRLTPLTDANYFLLGGVAVKN
jgi:hypothetical protein